MPIDSLTILSRLRYERRLITADLIVVGTRGMGAVKSVFFGSIATKVIHKAECPVLVVR